jgi:hypothetical protein
MSGISTPLELPPKSGRTSRSIKSSPRRTAYKLSTPPVPHKFIARALEEKAFGSADYEIALKSAALAKPYDVNSVRNEIHDIDSWTDEKLKELYRDERNHQVSKLMRFESQIQILNESMKKICSLTRGQCYDQANFLWKVWQSAGDAYSSVLESKSKTIDDLQLKLSDKTMSSQHWEEKYHSLYGKYSRLRISDDEAELLATVRQLEEKLKSKDQQIAKNVTTLTNLSVWFPNFDNFGNSILLGFLPPVSAEVIESNKDTLTLCLPTEIDKQMKLAKDYLLDDLKRIEDLNIGFQVLLPRNEWQQAHSISTGGGGFFAPSAPMKLPSPEKPSQPQQHPQQRQQRMSLKQKAQSCKFPKPKDDSQALKKGLLTDNDYSLRSSPVNFNSMSSDSEEPLVINSLADQLLNKLKTQEKPPSRSPISIPEGTFSQLLFFSLLFQVI